MISGLTARQHECLVAIERLSADGVSPSFEELRVDMGLSSRSDVHELIHQLKDRGAITVQPRKPRSIRVLPTKIGPDELQGLTSAQLRTTAAHIAGLLAHREGAEHAFQTFDRIGRRISGRPVHGEQR